MIPNNYPLPEHQHCLPIESNAKGKNIDWNTGEGISWMRLSKEEAMLIKESKNENK